MEVSSASRATSSAQPLAFMESSTASGEWPAAACATIQRRNSAVTTWALIGRDFAGERGALVSAGPQEYQRKLRLRLTRPLSSGVWSTIFAASRCITARSPSPWRCHWP